MYWDCPGRYYKRYIQRQPIPDDELDITETVPGKVVDRILQYFWRRVLEGRGAATFMFDPKSKKFDEIFTKYIDAPGVILGGEAFASTREEAKVAIGKLAKNMELMIETEQLLDQQEFLMPEGEDNRTQFGTYHKPLFINDWLSLSGGFDLFIAPKREFTGRLIDYKASMSTRRLEPEQLKLYQLAIGHKWKLKVGMAGFLLFRLKKTIWYRFDAEKIQATKDRLIRTAKAIDREEFDLTPSEAACMYCDFRFQCEKAIITDNTKRKKKRSLPVINVETPTALMDEPEL